MRTARLESPSWPGDRLLLAWARQTRGHRVRELASSPLAQVAPLGGVGADTGLMGSTRQTGAYQTACDHNQQWQRTMNAIIYKNTVQVSHSLSLLRLFTLALRLQGSMEGLWPCRYSRQRDLFHSVQGYPAIHALSPSGLISVQLHPPSYQVHILKKKKYKKSRQMYQTKLNGSFQALCKKKKTWIGHELGDLKV